MRINLAPTLRATIRRQCKDVTAFRTLGHRPADADGPRAGGQPAHLGSTRGRLGRLVRTNFDRSAGTWQVTLSRGQADDRGSCRRSCHLCAVAGAGYGGPRRQFGRRPTGARAGPSRHWSALRSARPRRVLAGLGDSLVPLDARRIYSAGAVAAAPSPRFVGKRSLPYAASGSVVGPPVASATSTRRKRTAELGGYAGVRCHAA